LLRQRHCIDIVNDTASEALFIIMHMH